MPWRPTSTGAAAAVIGSGSLALLALYYWATRHSTGMSPADAASLRLEAIKTALTVAAGIGAGITLLLALRRQRFTEDDAQEQRITELYVAAVEQLGNDKAAVRLGGLYALERLGQDNPKLRQTVIDVICAYLRMPYTPPAEILHSNAEHSPEHLAEDAPTPEPEQQAERRQELQVRLTAQRLIHAHTYAFGLDSYWRGPGKRGERMTLDLTGAALVGFDLYDCRPSAVSLARAQFYGRANLTRAQFYGSANLEGAQFHADARLDEMQFHDITGLVKTHFYGGADLSGAQFHRDTSLAEAQFHGDANLSGAQFHNIAALVRTQFHGYADLARAQFHRDVYLTRAQFHDDASLGGAQFHEGVDLTRPQFFAYADLRNVRARNPVTLPTGWTAIPVFGEELLRVEATQAPAKTPGAL